MPGARITIVDDDVSVGKALMRLLQRSSYKVEVFGSAAEFLTSLSHVTPDCLVVDLQMPDMTGLELHLYLAHIKIKIPMIIFTAHDELGIRERCLAAGVAAYLIKPLQKTALIAAINAATKRSIPKNIAI